MEKRKQRRSLRRSGNGKCVMSPITCCILNVEASLVYSNVFVWQTESPYWRASCFRWEEERYTDGVKWKFLEHKGPVFAPPYEPLPSKVKFYYDGKFVFIIRALRLKYSIT